MANLWITGDSWGVLDNHEPQSHWVNYYAQHYNLKNIYCLARSGISQDMINYITECVIKNVEWKDRDVKFYNMEDHLIIFPTTPTRITFNKVWDQETFDYNQGPHNLNWKTLSELQNPHPWQSEENHTLANLESENYTSLHTCDNSNAHIVESFGVVHPCAFADWRDTSHLKHIIKEVNNVKVYRSSKLPDQSELIDDVKPQGKEQINHLDKKRHIAYWRQLKKLL